MELFASFWDKVGDSLVLATPTIVALVAGYFQLRRDTRLAAKKVETQVASTATATNTKLDTVLTHVNGMVAKLESAAFTAGVKSETDKVQSSSPESKSP